MTSKKNAHKLLEWDKKEVYEADADRVVEIIRKKRKNNKKSRNVSAFYSLLDKVRIKL